MTDLPNMKLKALVPFPARVNGGVGIDVEKEHGVYTIDMDWSEFATQTMLPTNPTNNVLTYDTSTDSYIMIPSSLLGGATAGIADAPVNGRQYGRQSGAWTEVAAGGNVVGPVSSVADRIAIYNGITGKLIKDGGKTIAELGGFAADKRIYASTAGNDANSGIGPSQAKLTLQAAIDAASPGGTVYAGAGTFVQTVPLKMRPGVKLIGNSTIITQGNAANLGSLIDFQTNSAHGAVLTGCTVDGNRANNTDNDNMFLLFVYEMNDVVIENNSLINSPGYICFLMTGVRCKFNNNFVKNCYSVAFFINTGVVQWPSKATITNNRFESPLGQHVISLQKSDTNVVSGNRILASLIGTRDTPLRVNTSGTTVTWVSGPTFDNVSPGMFLVMNNGGEYFISAKASNTSLTVGASPGTTSNVLASIGEGDLAGCANSSANVFSDNFLQGGVTLGIGISNGIGGSSSNSNVIKGNQFAFNGSCAVSIQGTNNGTTIRGNSILNNIIFYPNQTDGAGAGTGAGAFRTGINVIGPAVLDQFIDGNTVTASNTIDYWLGVSNVPETSPIRVGSNFAMDLTNGADIFGGIVSVDLTGWGVGATATFRSQGGSYYVRITTGASGVAVYPTFKVNLAVCSPRTFSLIKCIVLATGSEQLMNELQSNTLGVRSFTFIGTPANSAIYDFYVVG